MRSSGADPHLVRGDRGRIVIGAITRIIGCLALIVVLFHDGVMLGLGQVTADQDAQVAVQAAAHAYEQKADVQKAYDAAALSVASKGSDVEAASFQVDPSTRMITLTVTRESSTMVANHFSWFDKVTHPKARAEATIEDASP